MADKGVGRKQVDWGRVELDYRAGVKPLRVIAEENGITHGAINKRAKRDGWERDLAPKIRARAESLVSKAAVSTEVSKQTKIAESAVVEANAQAAANVILSHRQDIGRARRLTAALFDELEQQTDPGTLAILRNLGEIMASPDEKSGRDRLQEIYQAVISLPERSKTMKTLTESLQKLVDMERVSFGVDDKKAPSTPGDITISF